MPVRLRGPIAPAVGRLNGGAKRLAAQAWLPLAQLLHVVEELQEHDPGEHGQAVEVAVETLVLPHDVAARLHDRGKPLGGGVNGSGGNFWI